jgi:hypothetical protein
MTLRIFIEALLCGLPIFLLFLFFYQISNWKIDMFRWGMVIFTFSASFPANIPKHLTNRVIEYKGLNFYFVSQKLGLFQSKTVRRMLRNPFPSGLFPLMGEIILGEAGDAKVIMRIPNSVILLFICTIISAIGLTILSKDIKTDFSSIITGICLTTLLIVFLSYAEKTQLENRFQKIKEYVLKNVE